jgi:hypothetical protein
MAVSKIIVNFITMLIGAESEAHGAQITGKFNTANLIKSYGKMKENVL